MGVVCEERVGIEKEEKQVLLFVCVLVFLFFFFKQKAAYEIWYGLVGSGMCIRDRGRGASSSLEDPPCEATGTTGTGNPAPLPSLSIVSHSRLPLPTIS